MYEQQKRRIIADYLQSPRCYKSVRGKPKRQFSSWKNYLNPDVAELASKIKAAKKQHYGYQTKQSKWKTRKQSEDDFLRRQSRVGSKILQVQPNTQYYGNWGTQMKTPKTCQTYRYSRQSLTGKPSALVGDKLSSISLQLKDQSIKSYDKTVESPNIIDQEIFNDIKDQLNAHSSPILPNERSWNQKQKVQKSNKISNYHMQLKEEERLYLLQKFMQHYEKIHNLKL